MITVLVLLGTALAGAAGSLLRAETIARAGPSGTASRARAVAAVNLGGAALVAALAVLPTPDPWRTVIGVGFCGALTTFSTWVVEAVVSREQGRDVRLVAGLDLVGQLVVGTAVVWLVLRAA